ncbi:hypothetical protein [Ruminococcus sp.]|uniref:hypothetical protein n=1 Tax=Ruminococcus sp. TaxID=41978 RepID=UPI001B4DA2D4|nr:hypothetical protein [Ruminococcus sp.]MBP5433698.1 hypothetical protein [Ruminococcus sp.]
MRIYVQCAADPKSFREIRQLKDRRKLSNFKVFEIKEYKSDGEFKGYTYIYSYEYNDKYYLAMDILNPAPKHRYSDSRNSVHRTFEDKNAANDYFRKAVSGKEWKRVE